jgi:threonine dehydratase
MTSDKLAQSIAAAAILAHRQLREHVINTPCLPSKLLHDVHLKCENFQTTGSFKIRGALSKLSGVPPSQAVYTASSGNHGIACAEAARRFGHRLTVFLPETVSKAKLDQIRKYDVDIKTVAGNAGGAEALARQRALADNAVYVPPYNDPGVIAGQGTIAVELLDQLPGVEVVYVAMGGGGLISGIASVMKALSPETRIIGVAAENSMALAAAMSAGRVVEVHHLETLADGCAGAIDEDSITLPLARDLVEEVVVCSEQEIRAALGLIVREERLLVEGSAALALAGRLKTGRIGERSSVVLCGANMDLALLRELL